MYLDGSMLSHLEKCEQNIAKLEKFLESMPEGEIQSYANGKYRTWRITYPDGKRQYLSKSELQLAKTLAFKKVYTAQLHDLKAEAEASRRYLRCKSRSAGAVDRLMQKMTPDVKALIGESLKTTDKKVADWENEPYERYDKYQENLVHQTLKDKLKVRSKIEADTANSLCILKIPFKYEKMTRVGNQKFAPDFTALDIRTFQEIIIEVFGMMDDPEYRQTYRKKMTAYINNGYLPGVNLLVFYETSATPLSSQYTMQTLEDFFINKPPIWL